MLSLSFGAKQEFGTLGRATATRRGGQCSAQSPSSPPGMVWLAHTNTQPGLVPECRVNGGLCLVTPDGPLDIITQTMFLHPISTIPESRAACEPYLSPEEIKCTWRALLILGPWHQRCDANLYQLRIWTRLTPLRGERPVPFQPGQSPLGSAMSLISKAWGKQRK